MLCLRRGSHDRAHRQQGSHDRAHLAAGSHDVIPLEPMLERGPGTSLNGVRGSHFMAEAGVVNQWPGT